MKRIESGKATFNDTFKYAEILSKTLGKVLASKVLELTDREGIAAHLLRDNYIDINDVCSRVQISIDKSKGLNLKPQQAEFPNERVTKFAHSLLDPTIEDYKIQRRARAGSENITLSFHDDFIEENAKFHDKAGMKCYIERIGVNCCPWCSDVSGKYEMKNQPKDIFKRHDNCDCIINYDGQVLRGEMSTNGKRSKKWIESPKGEGAAPALKFTQEYAKQLNDKNLELNKQYIDNSPKTDIIKKKTAEMVGTDVHKIGNIDLDIYKCVTEDIVNDEVIITDERIKHIKDNHPNDFEKYCRYMKEIVESPDYIIEANKPNSALILKSFEENGVPFKTILRLVTSTDNPMYKNSIITFMKIDEKEWKRLINNKKVLYKSE